MDPFAVCHMRYHCEYLDYKDVFFCFCFCFCFWFFCFCFVLFCFCILRLCCLPFIFCAESLHNTCFIRCKQDKETCLPDVLTLKEPGFLDLSHSGGIPPPPPVHISETDRGDIWCGLLVDS